MVIVAGTVGTVASLWLYENFVSWLSILSAAMPPIGAVIMTDYFINRSHYKDEYDAERIPKINVGSVAGIITGVLVGVLVDKIGIATLNSVLAACICYVVFNCRKIFGNMLAK
jgi:cytosine permease